MEYSCGCQNHQRPRSISFLPPALLAPLLRTSLQRRDGRGRDQSIISRASGTTAGPGRGTDQQSSELRPLSPLASPAPANRYVHELPNSEPQRDFLKPSFLIHLEQTFKSFNQGAFSDVLLTSREVSHDNAALHW